MEIAIKLLAILLVTVILTFLTTSAHREKHVLTQKAATIHLIVCFIVVLVLFLTL